MWASAEGTSIDAIRRALRRRREPDGENPTTDAAERREGSDDAGRTRFGEPGAERVGARILPLVGYSPVGFGSGESKPTHGGAERTESRRSETAHRAVLGFFGGVVATVVMTAFRLPISRSLPPTAAFWAKYVGSGPPDAYDVPALALHLLYGAVNGAVFGTVVFTEADGRDVVSEVRGTVLGLTFGLSLSAFGLRVVLGRLLGMDLDSDEWLVFHLGHVVYGLTLGVWLASRLADR